MSINTSGAHSSRWSLAQRRIVPAAAPAAQPPLEVGLNLTILRITRPVSQLCRVLGEVKQLLAAGLRIDDILPLAGPYHSLAVAKVGVHLVVDLVALTRKHRPQAPPLHGFGDLNPREIADRRIQVAEV